MLLRASTPRVRGSAKAAVLAYALASGVDVRADPSTYRPEAVGAMVGYTRGADVAVLGAQVRWRLPSTSDWLARHHLDAHLDAQIAYWQGRGTPTPYGHLWDFSVQPVLRWTPASSISGWFVEGAIGVHLLSATRINNDRRFGTAFQFGETIGAGIAFGPHREYEIELYVQHVSNANIKRDANWGLTYPGILFRMALPARAGG